MLNTIFGYDWDFVIEDQQIGKLQIWVRGKLTVKVKTPDSERTITKSQYGGKDIAFSKTTGKPLSIGNDLKAAASDCLKKSASLLGIASDVYAKEEYDLYNKADVVEGAVPITAKSTQMENTEGIVIEAEVVTEPKANSAQVTLIKRLLETGKIQLPENQLESEYLDSLTFTQAREIIQTNG